jgi:4'-phosphopantetheinyl transferase
MPLEKLEYQSNQRAWGLWHIRETERELLEQISEYESIPVNITHEQKRLEFCVGRVLAKTLLEKLSVKFEGIIKNEFGKPFFRNNNFQLSLSHSYPYVGALIDQTKSVGIDVEQIKAKLLKIAPRVLHPTELADAGNSETKHCIYWCAKEALIKIYGKKDLVFSEHLLISPFTLQNQGNITGRIIVNNTETTIPLYYEVHNGFTVVLNR